MTTHHTSCQPRGFTVMELLIVIAIMGLLIAFSFSAFNAAVAHSRVSRTKVVIAKLDQLVMEKYQSYRTRPVPIRTAATVSPRVAAGYRLAAIRDLMRMEMPDRKSDVVDPPCRYDGTTAMAPPSLYQGYRRKALAACGSGWATSWTETSQGAECLYLIVSSMRDQDKSALDFFAEGEVGDLDGDNMKEFLDAWGRPIEFLRWAPGYTTENGVVTMQTSDATAAHDPFDVLKLDAAAFQLHPLLFSGGPDKGFDIFTDNLSGFHRYANNYSVPNPYAPFSGGAPGTPMDGDGDGRLTYYDNITNHYQEAE